MQTDIKSAKSKRVENVDAKKGKFVMYEVNVTIYA